MSDLQIVYLNRGFFIQGDHQVDWIAPCTFSNSFLQPFSKPSFFPCFPAYSPIDERKSVLDAIRDELRERDYLPVLFDFR